MGLGFTEIIVIFLVVLLFFGEKRLPEVARAMGHAVQEFQKAKKEVLISDTSLLEEAKHDEKNDSTLNKEE